jgi:prolyl 4-hydroxylase
MHKKTNPISKSTPLTSEWKKWIKENLERGCTPWSLVDVMVKHNIDPFVAHEAINELSGLNSSTAISSMAPSIKQTVDNHDYIYETPRLPQSGNIIKTEDRDVRVTLRMAKPVVAIFDNILSMEECDELIRISSIKLKRSTTIDLKTGQEEIIEDRNSYGTFFALNENEFIARLDKRIASVMHWPAENGEGIQILNYKVGGEYKPHFDYFPPNGTGSVPHLAQGGQRVSTLVMYLNDVEEGGETAFPDIGLVVTPKKGSAVYFEYCNSHSQVDPLSLHSGMPVHTGEKWIATKWMRQSRYNY